MPPGSYRLGSGGLDPIDLSSLPPSADVGAVPGGEDRLTKHLGDLIRGGGGEGIARFTTLVSASHFTRQLVGDRPEWRGLQVDVDTAGNRHILRPDLRQWLDRNLPTPESMAKLVPGSGPWMVDPSLRAKAVDIIAAGFVAGLGHSAPEDFPVGFGETLLEILDAEIPEIPKPVFRCGGKDGMAAIMFGPCVIDGERERAYFTVGVSALLFDGDNTVGRGPTREELPAVVAALRSLAASYRPKEMTIFGAAPAAPAPETRRSSRPSLLLDVRSRMDPETVKLATFAVQGALPRQLRKARRWADAEEEKIATILREHGETAFEKTGDRGALLTRRRGRAASI